MILYHYDRLGLLHTGDFLSLSPCEKIGSQYHEILYKLFPNGISEHGEKYINDMFTNMPVIMPLGLVTIGNLIASSYNLGPCMCEWTFESVRRSVFPENPSRFQSMFCLSSPEELKRWPEITTTASQNAQLFEISVSDDLKPFDSALLRGGLVCRFNPPTESMCSLGFLPLASLNLANQYWSGLLSDEPRMEYLVPLPVQVGQKVSLDLA